MKHSTRTWVLAFVTTVTVIAVKTIWDCIRYFSRETLAGDTTYTVDDRILLAEFCAKAYDSDAIKAMKID